MLQEELKGLAGCRGNQATPLSLPAFREWEKSVRIVLMGWLAVLTMTSTVCAQDIVKPLKSEEYLVRYAYAFELLTEVLRRTTPKYGPYIEQAYTDDISVARSHLEAVKGKRINIMISDVGHKELDEGMIPIPFPIDKGLLGYRVALISKDNQAKIAQVKTLDQFRSLSVGQGALWGDVRVYEYNHVPVRTAETYDSLFLMLTHGRFDMFPRGVTEAPGELAAYRVRYPELAIEQHLLIKYAFAQCFYISKSDPRLATRISDGLEQMERDGSFDVFFNRHFARQLSELKLKTRTVIELKNPFLPSWVPYARKELWFDPAKAQ